MSVDWKRKKEFDGLTCGLKGCSRKAGGYLADTRPHTANKNGQLWYGPICEKCCQQHMGKAPDTLSAIWLQRNGLEDMAQLFNVPVDDMHARLLEHVPEYTQDRGPTIIEVDGVTTAVWEEEAENEAAPADAPAAETMTITLPPKAPILQEQQKAKELLEDVRAFQVNTRDDLQVAASVIQHANQLQKQLAEKRKAAKEEPNKVLASIDELYGPVTKYLDEIEQTLKGKVAHAQLYASQVQQQELMRAAQASQAGDNVTASQAMQSAASHEFELPPNLASAELMDFEEVNPLQIPRQYLKRDDKAIRAALKAGVKHIPGLHIFKKTQIKVKKP